MDEVIKNICQALKEEADAVISYTDKISAVSEKGIGDASEVLTRIRIDETEHIQNLTIELTKLISQDILGNEEGAVNG